MNIFRGSSAFILFLVLSSTKTTVWAQDSQAELAKKLNNPIASLVSVPMQLNYDENLGLNDQGKEREKMRDIGEIVKGNQGDILGNT